MSHSACVCLFLLSSLLAVSFGREIERQKIPECPEGSRPLLRPDGQPRKCLPHQNNICVNALPDKPDADTVCCYHNQVDYFCCLDASEEQCPNYKDITVVIHNALPHDPSSLKSYFFKEGIEDQIIEEVFNDNKDAPVNEDGFVVRRPRATTQSRP